MADHAAVMFVDEDDFGAAPVIDAEAAAHGQHVATSDCELEQMDPL